MFEVILAYISHHPIITTAQEDLYTKTCLFFYKMDEHNIKMAFHNVKKDMMEIKSNLLVIAERLEKLEASTEDSKSPLVQINSATKTAKKPAKKAAKKK